MINVLEQLLRIDIEAGAATADYRQAKRSMVELEKKYAQMEERLSKCKADMGATETDLRRLNRKLDELDERKKERSSRLFAASSDEEHRSLKRELDQIDRDMKDSIRKADDFEKKIESQKQLYFQMERDFEKLKGASSEESGRTVSLENDSSQKLCEFQDSRKKYLEQLDERVLAHYERLSKVTKNPNGPIARVMSNSCGNCHMQLPPQLLNVILRGNSVEFCPNCHHILIPGESS